MGLAVATHALAYALEHDEEHAESLRAQLAALNTLLTAEGLPSHDEPIVHGAATARDRLGGFPYSFVHYLRRAYARALENPGEPLTPVAAGEDPTADEVLDRVMYTFESHLICHSDCEGFYVPADFQEVLFPDAALEIPGGMVGSSAALLRELAYVARYLGITLVDGELSDAEIAKFANDEDEHPLYRERETWLVLFEQARVSMANHTLITFC
ncbi:hypothetical protein ACFVUS_36560 [Nocardia sp. NPDC058058]|uniref:hypothetical protein n=1 Tax=Nocardia sp. NPDC058058 TaxID=3346317 RepID=UPI0036D94209